MRRFASLLFVMAINVFVALTATDTVSAQFQCPAGSRPVPGGGGIMCQCPDGSYAGLYTGCRQPQRPQTQIPPGSVPCGSGYCPPATLCLGGNRCSPVNAVDCGNGQYCNPGQRCSAGGGCVPQEAVDCGQGRYCNSGMVCAGTNQCISQLEAARRDCDSTDRIRVITGCGKVISDNTESLNTRAEAYIKRGVFYRNEGNSDLALSDFDSAIKLNPHSARYFGVRGLTFNLRNNYDRAISDFGEAIRLDPNNAQFFTLRGLAYHQRFQSFPDRKDDLQRAKGDFEKALQLPPTLEEHRKSQEIARTNLASILDSEAKARNASPIAKFSSFATGLPVSTIVTGSIAAILAVILLGLLYHSHLRPKGSVAAGDSHTAPPAERRNYEIVSARPVATSKTSAPSSLASDEVTPTGARASTTEQASVLSKQPSDVLVGIGTIGVIGSVIWWFIFYSEVNKAFGGKSSEMGEALKCLVSNTGPCGFVTGLASATGHMAYHPMYFWISAVVLAIGLFLRHSGHSNK